MALEPPELVTVMAVVADVCPTATDPNAALVGDACRLGDSRNASAGQC